MFEAMQLIRKYNKGKIMKASVLSHQNNGVSLKDSARVL